MWCAAEIKEHDVSPEDVQPVKEEPHHRDVTPPTGGDSSPVAPPGPLEGEEHKDSNFRAVSGFFSGFAAAVQNTVGGGGV